MLEEISDWNSRHYRVGLDTAGRYTISTVKLPFDHGLDTKPLWYETMIFKDEDMTDIYMERYATETEAIDGHIMALEHAKSLDYKENK
jgi:hypothetical protein